MSMNAGRNTIWARVAIYLEMIKFEHSVFALPFAYFGAFLSQMKPPTLAVLFWITLAMVGARSLAMSLNRLVDKEIDRRNPRTAERALSKGLLSVFDVSIFAAVSLTLFLIAVYNLAPICRYLWPFFVAPFVVYPYTKRFTWLSHFILGACLGLAPIGAWAAIANSLDWRPLVIGVAVALWTAGFDIIYATQDVEIDRREGLFSVPAQFGIGKALLFAKVLHAFSVLILIFLGISFNLGFFYFTGVFVAAVLLAYENSLVRPDDLSRLNLAFFTMNGIISLVLFLFVALEIVFGGIQVV